LLPGLIIWYGTAAKFFNSASDSGSCGMCKFISSPSNGEFPKVSQGAGLYLKQTQDG
jgi:hypothetical protein